MATLTLGGIDHVLPEMNFLALERAWPYVDLAMSTMDPIAGTNAAFGVIAACIMEAEGFDGSRWGIEMTITEELPEWEGGGEDTRKRTTWPKDLNKVHAELTNVLRRKLKAREIGTVKLVMFEILKDAGIDFESVATGEVPGAEASPSQETAPDTSPSSSLPDVREEAGTV